MLEQMHPGKVTTPVREAVSVRDAYTAGMPVSVYDPSSKVAADYREAVSPIIAASTGARI
jgi:chromosome partitioning protein